MNTIYQIFTSILCLAFIGSAQAETSKKDVLKAIDELYESVAQSDHNKTDYDALLQKILEISGSESQLSHFVCTKYGNDWFIYDSKSSSTIGTGSSIDDCSLAVKTSKNGFICTRYGNDWFLYNVKKDSTMGTGSSSVACNLAVKSSKKGYICMRYGNDWFLYDVKKESTIGTGSSLDACNASL